MAVDFDEVAISRLKRNFQQKEKTKFLSVTVKALWVGNIREVDSFPVVIPQTDDGDLISKFNAAFTAFPQIVLGGACIRSPSMKYTQCVSRFVHCI